MMDVKHKRCRCGLSEPYFGLEGGKRVCCGKCKEPGMMDVINKRCRCGLSQPHFGLEGGKVVCCGRCKEPGMMDITKKDSRKRNLSIAAEKKTEKKRCRLQKDSRKDLLHAADEEVEPETSVGPPPGRGRSGQGRGCRVPDVTQELGGQHFSLASQGQDC